jgi:hypothetical protein
MTPRLEIREMKGHGKLTISHGGEEDECESVASEDKMLGRPLLSKLFGSGMKPLHRKGAHKMGKELGEHIKTLHGEGFLDDLVSGIGSVVGKMFGGGVGSEMGVGSAARDSAVNVYSKGIAPRRVVPNAIEADAQQAPDYAPNWFRSSGDIAGGAMYGRGPLEAHSKKMAGSAMPKQKRALSDRQIARNTLVKKIMTEKGMKLAEASRYIKENDLF